jgi:hypothetical protein
MKIITPTAIVLTCLLANAAAKKDFMPDHSDHGQEHIMTAADFDGAGAKMRVCPSGDCTSGKFMSLAVTSLTEYDAAGANVTTIDKFTPKDSDWTAIETSVMYGVNVSSTSFIVNLEVGAANIAVVFNLTASIFQGNATVEYGSQNLTVPAGALKFTVDISDWPFVSPGNSLALAVSLDAKGSKGKALGKPAKKAKGTDIKTDRVDLGESMFMDVPTYAFVDGEEVQLKNSSVVVSAGATSFEWVFPSFENTLHYDPVLGEDTTTTATSTTDTPTPSPASKLSLSGLAAVGLAALTFGFF